MKNILKALLVVITFWPFGAPAIEVETFALKNDMQVVVIPNKKVPAVSHMVWYKVGAFDEKPGKTGLAHYLEHLMFKGTEKIGPGQFSKKIAVHGGNDNAFTSYDYTGYFQIIAKEHLEMVMGMEADRMVNLKIPEKDALNERLVILEERSSSLDNDPGEQLKEKMRSSLYGEGHPYGKSVIGWRLDMEKLTAEEATEFYKLHYAPNNAILVVSGDVEPENVFKLAEKLYGNIPSTEIPERLKTLPVKLTETKEVHLKDPRVMVPELRRFYLAPSQHTDNKELSLPLVILSYILGGGETSRLYQSLVVDNKIAASAYASYDELALAESIFSIYAIPKKQEDIKATDKLIEKEIRKIIKNGVRTEEMEIAVNNIKAALLYSRDNLKGLGYIYGQALATGMPREFIDDYVNNLEKVSMKDVQKAAKYVLEQNYVMGVLEK